MARNTPVTQVLLDAAKMIERPGVFCHTWGYVGRKRMESEGEAIEHRLALTRMCSKTAINVAALNLETSESRALQLARRAEVRLEAHLGIDDVPYWLDYRSSTFVIRKIREAA